MNELIPEIAKELKSIKNCIQENEDKYDAHDMREQIHRFERLVERFFSKSSYTSLIDDACDSNEDIIVGDDVDENDEDHVLELLTIAINTMENELRKFGMPGKNDPHINPNIVINNQHNISQSQNLIVTVLEEVLKDHLTGRQFKEVEDIVKAEKDPEKAKSKVMDKLKSFGSDVLSNIVASLVTNPHLIGSIF